jgi:hypothetical protein
MTFKLGKTKLNYKPNDSIYTPPEVFEALGLQFDIDVCAPKGGLPWIPAKTSYHEELDGLAQPWNGLIWCNPPYSRPKEWILKFIDHANGIMLVNVSKSLTFNELWKSADSIILADARFKFIKPDMTRFPIFMPVIFAAMGQEATQALERSGLGRVR